MILLFFTILLFISTLLSIDINGEKITFKSIVEDIKDNRQINIIILFVGIVFEAFV